RGLGDVYKRQRPASAPGDKPAARKPQVKRRPKPAGDGMRPGFRR
ncbi:23S rRNA pseudouridylate synthase B, partial [Pseudomonas aeruginosa]|nr:23S rRNA pseudouridylate synthase B [Pseudomonas aeruginosa]